MTSSGGQDTARHRTSAVELDQALSFAETMLTQLERDRLNVLVARAGLYLAGVTSIGTAVGFLGLAKAVTAASMVASLAIALPILGVALVLGFVLSHLRHRILRDEHAMFETINLVRDLLPLVSEQEQWSLTQEQLVSKRVARFPIDRQRQKS